MIHRIVKPVFLSGTLALCMMLFGVGCGVSPDAPNGQDTTSETSDPLLSPKLTCDQFCQSEGGQFFRSTPAGSQAQCTAKGGDWSPTPAPGCCCKCTLANGNCD